MEAAGFYFSLKGFQIPNMVQAVIYRVQPIQPFGFWAIGPDRGILGP